MEPVTAIIGNRQTKFVCSPEVQVKLKEFFRYHKPGYEHSPKYKMDIWDGWTHLHRYGKVPTGLFLHREKELGEAYQLTKKDQRISPEFHGPEVLPKTEREFQDFKKWEKRFDRPIWYMIFAVLALPIFGIVLSAMTK